MEERSLAGKVIGNYRLLNTLGVGGGGGMVYMAQRVDEPAALFAIKLLDLTAQPDLTIRATLQARFQREAEALARLQHPHILPLVNYGQTTDGKMLYMTLPFMNGGTLADKIGAYPRGMPLDMIMVYLEPLAEALDCAHYSHIIHRDIKPSNVLLDEQGQIYLADFGIARLVIPNSLLGAPTSTPATLTVLGQALGTPQYMAPEQINGAKVGPTADVYSSGIMLYQMVTGALPFQADTPLAIAMLQLQAAPPALRAQRPDLPPAAEAVILRALAKRPEERYPSAGEFAQAFKLALNVPTYGVISPVTTIAAPVVLAPATPDAPPGAYPPTYVGSHVAYTPSPLPQRAPPQQPFAYNVAPAHPDTPAQWPTAPAPRSPFNWGWAIVALVVLLALILVGFNLTHFSPLPTSLLPKATVTATLSGGPKGTATAQWARPIVPAGSLIYETHAAGPCDQQGASWASNDMVTQSCQNGALIMSAQECNCAIGVETLTALPDQSYPHNYVAQVHVNILGGASDAKFGFKFFQQSIQDSDNGRGGFSFLVDPNGQWQFNRYDPNGTRNIMTQDQLPTGLHGAHTLDLAVSENTYTFFIDGRQIDQEQDSLYTSGYFCLAIEPGATIAFSDLALFQD